MRSRKHIGVLITMAAALAYGPPRAHADTPLGVEDVVKMALEHNPQVRSAQARWASALHSIKQNYAPADPIVSFLNLDSHTNGVTGAAAHSLQVNQPLQFPGKAFLQADTATRTAEIARLTYEATLRDVRAQAQTAFYQILLDQALDDLAVQNTENLRQVLHVAQVAYAANRVTQADFISAEFARAVAEQQQRQFQVAAANDRTTLNQVLDLPLGQAVPLRQELELPALDVALDSLVSRANQVRQEILQAALAEENAATALTLAKLEYAPDFSVGYTFNHYLSPSAPPVPGQLETHSLSLSLNVPLFYWLKQREDVTRTGDDLEAARADRSTIQVQTAAQVTVLFREAQLAYQTAQLYRETLSPLAQQGFQVALVAYEGGKVDFVTLASALRQRNDARSTYLQAANQYLAQRIAMEQAIGQPVRP